MVSPPVDMVEVAVVEVKSSTPVRVRLVMFKVPRLAVPDTKRSPDTERVLPGVVVPRPIL